MRNVYSIDGIDFAKYNPELDWSGRIFDEYQDAMSLRYRAGVYAFTLCDEVVYVGSSMNLFGRLQTHIAHIYSKSNKDSSSVKYKKYYYLNKYLPHVKFYVLCFFDSDVTKSQLEEKEYSFINQYCPIFNVNYKDSIHRWNGSEQDIDSFVNGTIHMNDLKIQITQQND